MSTRRDTPANSSNAMHRTTIANPAISAAIRIRLPLARTTSSNSITRAATTEKTSTCRSASFVTATQCAVTSYSFTPHITALSHPSRGSPSSHASKKASESSIIPTCRTVVLSPHISCTPETFHRFAELPTELQCIIWRYAATPDGIIKLNRWYIRLSLGELKLILRPRGPMWMHPCKMSRFLRTKEGQHDHDYTYIMDFSNILMSRRALMATCVISKEITVMAWDEDCRAFAAWAGSQKPEMECPCKAEMLEWCSLRRDAI